MHKLDDPVLGSLTLKIDNVPMPPSVNALYFTKGNRRILTTEGRIYKDSIKEIMANIAATQRSHDITLENISLGVSYDFFFKNIESKSWKAGKSANRFRKNDISNRVKVLEDGIVEGLGIDDTQFKHINLSKLQAVGDSEYVNIRLYRCWEDINVQGTRH